MRNYIYIILFLYPYILWAQKNLVLANEAYETNEYYKAITLYKEVLRKTRNNSVKQSVCFNLGKSYQGLSDFKNAQNYYEKSYNAGNKNPELLFRMGQVSQANSRYNEAIDYFSKYLEYDPADTRTKNYIKSCRYALNHSGQKTGVYVSNLSKLNSVYADYAPLLFNNQIIFTSARIERNNNNIYPATGQAFSDYYISEYNSNDEEWNYATRLKDPVNTLYNEGTCSFDETTNTMYIMQCNGMEGDKKNCTIYTSVYNKSNNAWSFPEPVNTGPDIYNYGHPAVSADGRTLYFTSDMPQGFGGKDIWLSAKLNDGSWSIPVNAGNNINTEGDEVFPYVYKDSLLFFASDGHTGFGGLDIYYSVILNNGFATPLNMERPVNSGYDDFSIFLYDADSGLFSSNRPGGIGDDDIYLFYTHIEKLKISGYIYNNTDNSAIPDVTILLSDGQNHYETTQSDKNGFFIFSNLIAHNEYIVTVYKEGFLGDVRFIKADLSSYEKKEIETDFNFSLIRVSSDEINIKNIYYDFGKWNLTEESEIELNKLVYIMQINPEIKIQINSHTDIRGDEKFNQELSDYRARSVVDFLIKNGINQERLSWKGWGETRPILANAQTDEEHQLNRRTTFRILNPEDIKITYSTEKNKELVSGILTARVLKEQQADSVSSQKKRVVFRVQVYAGSKKMPQAQQEEMTRMAGKYELIETQDQQGIYRYAIGEFKKFEQAKHMNDLLKANNYEPYITAFMNDIRITILEARQLTEGN